MKLSSLPALLLSTINVHRLEPSQAHSSTTPSTGAATISVPLATLSSSLNIRYPPPSVRHAPNGYLYHDFAHWTPPDQSGVIGGGYITHASGSTWKNFRNLRVNNYRLASTDKTCAELAGDTECPQGSLYNVLSWTTCNSNTSLDCDSEAARITISGFNLPIGALGPTDQKYAAAWTYYASPQFHDKSYGHRHAIIAWGVDEENASWLVNYAADTSDRPAKGSQGYINIESKNVNGPSHRTTTALVEALKDLFTELQDQALYDMVDSLHRTAIDGRRSGN